MVTRKAVFLDVDGTYVDDRGLVPDSAAQAVAAARANGHLVFLCTGRSIAELWSPVTDVGFDGVIASAGAHIEVDGQLLVHRVFPVEHVVRVVDYFNRLEVAFYLQTDEALVGSPGCRAAIDELIFAHVTDERLRRDLDKGLGGFLDRMVEGLDMYRDDVTKVVFLDAGVPIESVRAEFRGLLDIIHCTVPAFGPNSGEMMQAGVHKAYGIQTVLEHVGLPHEVSLGFGDGPNDLEMLAFVHTGVAMGNATEAVKAVADEVTGRVDEDGLYEAFRKHELIDA